MIRHPASEERVARLLAAARAISLRDALVIDLMYEFGLRPGEVSLIRPPHVILPRRLLYVTRLCGGRSQWYLLPPMLAADLSTYVAGQAIPADRPVFPLDTRRIGRLLRCYDEALTPHELRLATAAHRLTAGWRAIDVYDQLGLTPPGRHGRPA